MQTKCLGGKGTFHIFCLEFAGIYHGSHTNKLGETHANSWRSHNNSYCHLKAYEKGLDQVDVSKVNDNVEDTI